MLFLVCLSSFISFIIGLAVGIWWTLGYINRTDER